MSTNLPDTSSPEDVKLRTRAAQEISTAIHQSSCDKAELIAQALMINLFVLLEGAPPIVRNAWAKQFAADLQELAINEGEAIERPLWPQVRGVSRDANALRDLSVSFARAPTDDEMRAVHDTLRGFHSTDETQDDSPPAAPVPNREPKTAEVTKAILARAVVELLNEQFPCVKPAKGVGFNQAVDNATEHLWFEILTEQNRGDFAATKNKIESGELCGQILDPADLFGTQGEKH